MPGNNTFLSLNKNKVRFAFIVTSLACLLLAFIFLLLAYFNGTLPNAILIFIILLTAGIAFPVFILSLACLEWLYKRKLRKRIFSKPPFNQLADIGFYTSYLNADTKWFFTEQVKEIKLNGFTLMSDISKSKSKTVDVHAHVAWRHIEKEEFNLLSKKFSSYNIEFEVGGLVKHYNLQKLAVHNIDELKADLKLFTSLLKEEGFEPGML